MQGDWTFFIWQCRRRFFSSYSLSLWLLASTCLSFLERRMFSVTNVTTSVSTCTDVTYVISFSAFPWTCIGAFFVKKCDHVSRKSSVNLSLTWTWMLIPFPFIYCSLPLSPSLLSFRGRRLLSLGWPNAQNGHFQKWPFNCALFFHSLYPETMIWWLSLFWRTRGYICIGWHSAQCHC